MNTQQYIRNPISSRPIKVNGPTYNDLKARGVKLAGLPSFSKLVKQYPVHSDEGLTEEELIAILELEAAYLNAGSKPSKGWASAAPKKGKERQRLYKECGSRCFLSPGDMGFPICPACRSATCQCQLDCRGLLAAKVRGKQWKYGNIAKAADQLAKKKGCDWTKKYR